MAPKRFIALKCYTSPLYSDKGLGGLPEWVYICVFWAKSARSGGLSLYICNFVSKVGEITCIFVRKVFQVGEYMQNLGKNRAKVVTRPFFREV